MSTVLDFSSAAADVSGDPLPGDRDPLGLLDFDAASETTVEETTANEPQAATDPTLAEAPSSEPVEQVAQWETEGGAVPSADQPTEPAPAKDVKQAKAEDDLREEIQEAEANVATCFLRQQRLEADLKAAKKETKEAAEELHRLLLRAPENEDDDVDDDELEEACSVKETPEADATNADELPPTLRIADTEDRPVNDDAWRSMPTANLTALSSIKGLGKGKRTALTEAFPTLGELESARARAADQRTHFSKQLPKGIGNDMADAIENALLAAMNSTANVPMGEVPTEPASEEATSDGEAANEETASDETPAWKKEVEADDRQILKRAEELDTGEPGCLDQKLDGKGWWQSGYDAWKEGYKQTDCTIVPGPERDDWLRGWLAADVVEALEPGEEGNESND